MKEMIVKIYEGVVENREIRLESDVKLPDYGKVFVVVSDKKLSSKKIVQILSPLLANRMDAAHFKMTVAEDKSNLD